MAIRIRVLPVMVLCAVLVSGLGAGGASMARGAGNGSPPGNPPSATASVTPAPAAVDASATVPASVTAATTGTPPVLDTAAPTTPAATAPGTLAPSTTGPALFGDTATATAVAVSPTAALPASESSATDPTVPLVSAPPPLGGGAGAAVPVAVAALHAADAADSAALFDRYNRLPLGFAPNRGQDADGAVAFVSRALGYSVSLGRSEIALALRSGQDAALRPITGTSPLSGTRETILHLQFACANPSPQIVGEAPLPGVANDLTGSDPRGWITNLPTYARVVYHALYPGIDLAAYGTQRRLEYDWTIAPGADPRAIRLAVQGAKGVHLAGDGALVIETDDGQLRAAMPHAYQDRTDGAGRQDVAVRYVLGGTGQIGLAAGAYDATRPLVIDPVLAYSTYYGQSKAEQGNGIAVDGQGNAYVVGSAVPCCHRALYPNAPSTSSYVLVLKLNAAGSAVVYSTTFGGLYYNYGNGIAVDAGGDAYVTGQTYAPNFPTVNALQSASPGCALNPGTGTTTCAGSGFVTKLSPAGAFVYSTYLGGSGDDRGTGIAIDGAGNAYVTGTAGSTDFPTANALQGTPGGGDAFVAKVNAAGSALVYSTYLGGGGGDQGNGIAVDAAGSAYVAGATASANFPTANALQGASGGGVDDAFVAKLTPAGGGLAYSTYLGGSGDDRAYGVAVDPAGGAYVTGETSSTDFPTAGAVQGANGGGSNYDAFATKLVGAASGTVPWRPHRGVRLSDGLGASVDLADGHIDINASDLSIPGRGPSLALNHTWDSTLAQGSIATTAGQGWATALTQSMGGVLTGTVVYTDSTGATWPFTYTGAPTDPGPYTAYGAPPGQPWQLAASASGYTLTNFLTGAVTRFDASGRYLSDTDSYGNNNALGAPGGGVQSWGNSGGRALLLSVNANGLLADAQSPLWQSSNGAQGQHVTYGYGGPSGNQLTSLTRGAGTPDAVTDTFGYSGTQLVTVTTPAGRAWAIGYDPFGRVGSLTSPASGTVGQPDYVPAYTTQFTYGATQTQVIAGYGTGGALTTTYTLDDQGEATGIADGLGDTSRSTYDADHDVTSSTDADGNTTTYAYQYVGATGNVGLLTRTVRPPVQPYSPLNPVSTTVVTTRTYDPATYDLVETDRPEGGRTRYTYDGHHGVVATTELTTTNPMPLWRGAVNQYDQYGELTATTDGRGVAVDANGTATLADPQGLYTRHMAYDAQGDQTGSGTPVITTTLGGLTTTAPVTTSETYDADGERTASTSANGGATTYGYDHLGRQVTTAGPTVTLYDGSTTTPTETTGYDADGNVARTTDANGATTTSSYDPLGRLVSTTNPAGATSTTTYNATEQVSAQDAQGNVTTSGYDAAGRLIRVADALTGTVQYGYDAAGNTTAITTGDTLGNVTTVESRQYDALDRAITDTVTGPGAAPQTTATRYDKDGNVYQVDAPTGAATVDTYDLADQLVTSETDGAPVLSATHQSQTTYRYDAAGNTVETIDPAGRDTTTGYDGDNRAVQSVSTAPGVSGTTVLTTTTQYDPDGNTLAQAVQTQDPSGNVQTATDTSTYNAADWETSSTDNGLTTAYGYDAAGQRRSETIGNGASTVTRTIDPEGRETALAEGGDTTGFGYNSNDLITAITLPGGVQESAQYDANNRLTVWHDPGPGQNVTYAYGYDAAGRVTSFTAVSGTDTLAYDALDRLTSDCGPQVVAKSADHCYHWAYDGDGNITSTTTDFGTPITYNYTIPGQPDALARIDQPGYPNPAVYYSYDGSGDTTAITSPVGGSLTDPRATNTHIAYDAAGRPATITLRDGRTITIAYNAQGQRASYTVVTGTNTTLYSAQFAYRDGALAQSTVYSATATGSVQYTDSYVYGANGLPDHFARTQNGVTNRYWYETDGRGDIVAVTSITGAVVDSYQYDLWGEELPGATHEQVPQRLRYGGLWYDSEPEWSWDGSGARYYDPELERYLQPANSTARDYTFADDAPVAPVGSPDAGGRVGLAGLAGAAHPDPCAEAVSPRGDCAGGGDVGPIEGGGEGGGGGGDEGGSDNTAQKPAPPSTAEDGEADAGVERAAGRSIFDRLSDALKAEIRSLKDAWSKGTFDEPEHSAAYHWDKWGRGRGLNPREYTNKARALYDNRGGRRFTVTRGNSLIRITGEGKVGIYTEDGKIVTFRYAGDRPFQR